MSLSCSCDYIGDDTMAWWYDHPSDYTTLKTKRRQRCKSCGELIAVGATVARFRRWREPRSDIEDAIYGEGGEIHLAPYHLCETCADLYFSLMDLGFGCISPEDPMHELVKQYAETYGANHG